MPKAYIVPTPFALTPRKMSKPDQSTRQDLKNHIPLPCDAVSKVHLNTRCNDGVQISLLFTACHSDCLLFWVCNPNWCQITHCVQGCSAQFVSLCDRRDEIHFFTSKFSTTFFHKQIFNSILTERLSTSFALRCKILLSLGQIVSLDRLCYKSYMSLFSIKLLEISSAFSQNIKVGRKTFMAGKI